MLFASGGVRGGSEDLFPDAMPGKDGMEDGVWIQEVGAEDGIDGGEGAAEVFRHEFGGHPFVERQGDFPQRGRRLQQGLVVALIGDKAGLRMGN